MTAIPWALTASENRMLQAKRTARVAGVLYYPFIRVVHKAKGGRDVLRNAVTGFDAVSVAPVPRVYGARLLPLLLSARKRILDLRGFGSCFLRAA